MFRRVAESSIEYESLPNLQKLGTDLWRGGQPYKEGFIKLKDSGIKTVVNLRDEQSNIKEEQILTRELGLQFISIPISPFNVPAEHAIEQFFEIMEETDNHTVFVHCLHGMDRTGCFCALYRMYVHDWSFEDAYAEMLNMGFHEAFENLRQVVVRYGRNWGKTR